MKFSLRIETIYGCSVPSMCIPLMSPQCHPTPQLTSKYEPRRVLSVVSNALHVVLCVTAVEETNAAVCSCPSSAEGPPSTEPNQELQGRLCLRFLSKDRQKENLTTTRKQPPAPPPATPPQQARPIPHQTSHPRRHQCRRRRRAGRWSISGRPPSPP
jgi:hypothetical protein